MRKYIALDGGTTNTRLRLISDGHVTLEKKLAIGAGSAGGGAAWSKAIADGMQALLSESQTAENEIAAILASGMLTSEYGVFPLAHLPAPAGLFALAKGMAEGKIEGIDIPVYVIPGVKMLGASAEETDMMRGEEAEVMGLLPIGGTDCVYVLPGTHAKHVFVDGEGRISHFSTFMTGEMIAAISSATILRDAVDLSIEGFDPEALLRGYDAACALGLTAALFKTRIMKNLFSADARACYSFFLGALLSDEICALEKSGASRVLVAGKASLREPTLYLLEKRGALSIVPCDAVAMETASALGAIRIFEEREKNNA